MIAHDLIATLLLAAKPSAEQQKELASNTFFWLGVLVAIAFVMGVGAWIVKRRLAADDDPPPLGFSLRDLRELHARGELTDEELRAAEERALARERAKYLGSDPASEEADVTDIGDITDLASGDSGPSSAGSETDATQEVNPDNDPDPGAEDGKPENPR